MSKEEAQAFLERVKGWKLKENRVQKVYRLKDFKESMEFVNRVADLAEEEGHHPNIAISWNKVTLTLTTHAIGGLSQNDFILAAKIDKMKQMRMHAGNT